MDIIVKSNWWWTFLPYKKVASLTRWIFWSKPITDKEGFTITLYLFGKWIITSQYWAFQSKKTAIKHFKRIKWILANTDSQHSRWFYFHLHNTITTFISTWMANKKKLPIRILFWGKLSSMDDFMQVQLTDNGIVDNNLTF